MNTTNSREWSLWSEGGPYALPPDNTPSLLPVARLCCAGWRGFVCTRLPGHTGRHAAGEGDFIVAVWADPTSDPVAAALDAEQETTP